MRTARTARGWVDTWGVEEEVVLARSCCRGGDAFHTPVQLLEAAVQPGPAALRRVQLLPAAAVCLQTGVQLSEAGEAGAAGLLG